MASSRLQHTVLCHVLGKGFISIGSGAFDQRLLLRGRERLRRRAISCLKDCGGLGTPRNRSAGR